jgi:hypothetical protein
MIESHSVCENRPASVVTPEGSVRSPKNSVQSERLNSKPRGRPKLAPGNANSKQLSNLSVSNTPILSSQQEVPEVLYEQIEYY